MLLLSTALVVYLQSDPSTTFGWVETLFTELGVWDDITNALAAIIILGVSGAVLRFIR